MTGFRRILAPAMFLTALAVFTLFSPELTRQMGLDPLAEHIRIGQRLGAYLGVAWFLSRIADMFLTDFRPRNRPVPKLLRDLLTAVLFLIALISGGMLLMGHSAGSALAGSGVVLALIGFAIRNVVADTLSGIALGLEAPFRIGDWVDIEALARGRVVEIGWRTTRLLTRDSTYVILPNSQISRQRIVNYSAPRPDFRAQMEITLDHTVPVGRAVSVLSHALQNTPLIKQSPPPDVRIQAIGSDGIRYALRYWLDRFDHEIDARDAIWQQVDTALRLSGISLPSRRVRVLEEFEHVASPTNLNTQSFCVGSKQ